MPCPGPHPATAWGCRALPDNLGPTLQSCPRTVGPSDPVPNKTLAPALSLAGTWTQFTQGPCPQGVSLQCPRPRPALSLSRMWLFRGTR